MKEVLRTYLPRSRRLLTVVVLLQGAAAILALLLPTINATLLDEGALAGDRHQIWVSGAELLVVALLQFACAGGAVYAGAKAAMAFGRDVRSDLFHRVTAFSAREVGAFGAPSLITRITNDVQQVQMLVVMGCLLLVNAPITLIGGVVLAIRQDVGLSWLLVAAIPALAICLGLIVSRMVPRFRVMQDRIDVMNRVLREQIAGLRVVRAFVREPDEAQRFKVVNDELTDTSLRAGWLMALMFPTLMLIVNLSSVGVLWIGARRIDSGDLTIGSLIAFLTYFMLILMSVMMATFVAMMAPRAAVCAERLQEVLHTSPSVVPPSSPQPAPASLGVLELRDVGFRYPGAEQPVLAGVALTCRPGTTTAIVGSTGAGKTTLINLVARLVDATQGAVVLGGVDVRDLSTDVLWDRVGLVPQRPYLFAGSVASNLRYGKPDATDHEMWEALEVAQAADFVRVMGGLEASIAQGGSNVSGGQRQRLSIARALVRRPDVYLFDDSFSALDVATDARLRAALRPHTTDATVLLVAQRVSTVATADQILVLEDGMPVGVGTHDELVATCPTYAEIVSSQMGAERAA